MFDWYMTSGSSFTWYNKREAAKAIFARLDRVLTNHHWLNLYPTVVLKNLLIIRLSTNITEHQHTQSQNRYITFKFVEWLLNESLFPLVNNIWTCCIKGLHHQLNSKNHLLEHAI